MYLNDVWCCFPGSQIYGINHEMANWVIRKVSHVGLVSGNIAKLVNGLGIYAKHQ